MTLQRDWSWVIIGRIVLILRRILLLLHGRIILDWDLLHSVVIITIIVDIMIRIRMIVVGVIILMVIRCSGLLLLL